MIEERSFFNSKQNIQITAYAKMINSDLEISLLGGDFEHIGGILTWDAMSQEEKRLVFKTPSGKEHEDILLADILAKKVKSNLSGNLCILAGIHIDDISQNQIQIIIEITQEIGSEIMEWLGMQSIPKRMPKYPN